MSAPAADYHRADVVDALQTLGVREGDVVFTHAGVGMLGRPAEGLERETIAALFLTAFQEVLGPGGTWILPAYSYSYTRGEPFDPAATPPRNMGVLSEILWRHPEAARSLDPIFSVVALGGRAQEIAERAADDDCFGPRSVYALLLELDGAVCNVGIGSHSAFIHHVEQRLGVPYRFPKRFRGTTVVDGSARETEVVYNVRALDNPRHVPYFMRLDADGRREGLVRGARVGRGEINHVRVRDMKTLIEAGLARDPEYLVLGELASSAAG